MPPKNDSSCYSIYKWIVDEVVVATEEEFRGAAHVPEATIAELRQRWEQKLMEQGLLGGPPAAAAAAATAADPTDAHAAGGSQQHIGHTDAQGPSGVVGAKRKEPDSKYEAVAHQRQQYQAQIEYLSQLQQRQVAYPQQQQQAQAQAQAPLYAPPAQAAAPMAQAPQYAAGAQQHQPPQQQLPYTQVGGTLLPQHDGPADAGGEDDEGGDFGGDEAPGGAGAEQGESLSSDDGEEQRVEEEVENLLIGQFDKVNKMKQRWKVTMKDCVFHINGRDHLFKKCTGEFLLDL